MSERAIQTQDFTKHYGDLAALDGVSLDVEVGEVFGFLGPNGAGKTTAIRSMLNYLHPTRGTANLLGFDSVTDSVELRRHIGYLPGEYQMYGKLTGAQMLRYFANLRGGMDENYVAALAERLKADLDRKVRDYSTGNKQKIGLIQAFMSRPQLLILDEPSTGLDPLMQQELQQMIREVREDGRTVFLSSHSLTEVQHVADRVGILRSGNLIEVARVADLMNKAVRRLDLEFTDPITAADFAHIDHIQDLTTRGNFASVAFDGPISDLLQVALAHDVVNLNSREADLEEVFLTYYRDPDADQDTTGGTDHDAG